MKKYQCEIQGQVKPARINPLIIKRSCKRVLPLVFLLFLFISGSSYGLSDQRTFQKDNAIYAHASQGLSIRALPTTTSSKLGSIAYGSKIIIEEPPNILKRDTIEKIDGYWIQIKYKDISGYVFSGLVSTFPAPRTKSRYRYPTQLDNAGFKNAVINDELQDPMAYLDPKEDAITNEKSGIILKDASLIDAFLIVRNLYIKRPLKDINLPTEFRGKKTSIPITNTPYTLSRGIKIERNTENRILRVAYCEKRQNSLEKIVIAENNNNSVSIIRRYVDFREEKGQNCWEKPTQNKQQISSSQ